MAAKIQVIEPTGSETQVIMSLGDAQMHGESKMIGAFRERIAERPGQDLRFAPDLTLVHLFDEATGTRLN